MLEYMLAHILHFAGKRLLEQRAHTLGWLFSLAALRSDTASTLRVAARMTEALSLGADDALVLARRHATMFRVFGILPYLYASMPDDALAHIAARYQFDIRGPGDLFTAPGGHLVAFMHTWDYWYGVMALMIRVGQHRSGYSIGINAPDAYRLAVAERMKRAGFSLNFVDGTSPSAMRRVVRALRDGAVVFLFSDFYPYTDRTLPVRWFGRSGRLPSGPLELAALADVPVTIAETHIDGMYREWVQLTPMFAGVEAPSSTLMQEMATSQEQQIRTFPEHWRCWERFEDYFYGPSLPLQYASMPKIWPGI